MPNRKTHLGEAELEIMQILWSARQPQTAREILAQLQGKRPWALDYQAQAGKSFLQRLYGGSLPSLVASLYDSQAIGKEDLEELKAYLNALEGGEKDA